MIPAWRTARVLPPLLLLPALLLTGCGTEKAGEGTARAGAGAGSGGGTSTAVADPTELAARAKALGIAPELVYVTESPGYTLAQQSVGVSASTASPPCTGRRRPAPRSNSASTGSW